MCPFACFATCLPPPPYSELRPSSSLLPAVTGSSRPPPKSSETSAHQAGVAMGLCRYIRIMTGGGGGVTGIIRILIFTLITDAHVRRNVATCGMRNKIKHGAHFERFLFLLLIVCRLAPPQLRARHTRVCGGGNCFALFIRFFPALLCRDRS